MNGVRIHITGASGAGTSTLGRALADRLGSQAFDTDDFYWLPTETPFREERPLVDRLRLMDEVFLGRGGWILSGSLHPWGLPAMERVTHVVFLTLDPARRLARLRARERRRFGRRIAPGGDMEAAFQGFLNWAMSYDEPSQTGRSRAGHEAWLENVAQPVIRLDAERPVPDLVQSVLEGLRDDRDTPEARLPETA